MIHSKGVKYTALFRQATAATCLPLPKKHMPMLFHSWEELGVWVAATRYFTNATS